MINTLYKFDYHKKYKMALGIEAKTDDKPPPLIDPDFSMFCQSKMKNGESILPDMKERYPNFIPQLDEDFVNNFLCYVDTEGPDFSELLEVFLINNTESLIKCDVMKLLFSKLPHSFNHIYIALEFGGDDAFNNFDYECGFYFMIKYSSDPNLKLVISQILQLTISKITDFGICTMIPINPDDFFSEESETVYEDLEYNELIANLLGSEDEEIILSTLTALNIGFKNKVEIRVQFGPVFMEYFEDFIANPAYSEATLSAYSVGADGIPEYLTERDHILEIAESLLSTDDNILVESGIKLPLQLLSMKLKKNPKFEESPLSIFQNSDVIQLIFQIAKDGTYKMKVLSFEAINELIKASRIDELGLFFEYGIFELLNDTFSGETSDTIVDKELIIACIEILFNIQDKNKYNNVKPEEFQKMIDLFKYLDELQYNEDSDISNQANQAYSMLLPYYGEYLYIENHKKEEEEEEEEEEEKKEN